MTKYGLIVQKKEMTRVWVDDKLTPVTLVVIPQQEVVRYKTAEKDGYTAMVLGVEKQSKNDKVSYKKLVEFTVDEDFIQKHEAGSVLDVAVLDTVEQVTVQGIGRGKGFQGVMKRFHAKGGNKTRGSKFHRQVGSMGNRKPRRTMKGHPHAGRMGSELTTLKNISILDRFTQDGDQLIALKGSIPGSYNALLKVKIQG